jgi:hypothetical protein
MFNCPLRHHVDFVSFTVQLKLFVAGCLQRLAYNCQAVDFQPIVDFILTLTNNFYHPMLSFVSSSIFF